MIRCKSHTFTVFSLSFFFLTLMAFILLDFHPLNVCCPPGSARRQELYCKVSAALLWKLLSLLLVSALHPWEHTGEKTVSQTASWVTASTNNCAFINQHLHFKPLATSLTTISTFNLLIYHDLRCIYILSHFQLLNLNRNRKLKKKKVLTLGWEEKRNPTKCNWSGSSKRITTYVKLWLKRPLEREKKQWKKKRWQTKAWDLYGRWGLIHETNTTFQLFEVWLALLRHLCPLL